MNLQNSIEKTTDETKATVRTTTNVTILVYIALAINWLFGWNISLDDLIPFGAAIPFVIAFFNRSSRFIAIRFPSVGWVLFGYGEEPRY